MGASSGFTFEGPRAKRALAANMQRFCKENS